MKEKTHPTYLTPLRTILPSAAGARDIRFLCRGMNTLIAEIDHAIARLPVSAQFLTLKKNPWCHDPPDIITGRSNTLAHLLNDPRIKGGFELE